MPRCTGGPGDVDGISVIRCPNCENMMNYNVTHEIFYDKDVTVEQYDYPEWECPTCFFLFDADVVEDADDAS